MDGRRDERWSEQDGRVRFDGYEFDLATGELWRDGDPVALAPQPTRLLVLLVRRAGRLVTREAIRDEVWGDTVVEFGAAINNAIRETRDALGDDASSPRFVETVPRRGYRFRGEVRPAEPETTEPESEQGTAPSSTSRRRWLWPVAFCAIVLLVVVAALPPLLGTTRRPPTVTVVPVRTAEAESELEPVAERIGAELERALGTLEAEGVRFLPWRGRVEYDREAGRILVDGEPVQVDVAVDVNVSMQGDSLRIAGMLIGIETGTQLWYGTFMHPAEDPEGAIARVRARLRDEVRTLLVPRQR